MRLIDADMTISELKKLPAQECLEYIGLFDLIKSMPTIDAEPVVYCRDCKCYEHMKCNNSHFCNRFGGSVIEKDFCSRPRPKKTARAKMDGEQG